MDNSEIKDAEPAVLSLFRGLDPWTGNSLVRLIVGDRKGTQREGPSRGAVIRILKDIDL